MLIRHHPQSCLPIMHAQHSAPCQPKRPAVSDHLCDHAAACSTARGLANMFCPGAVLCYAKLHAIALAFLSFHMSPSIACSWKGSFLATHREHANGSLPSGAACWGSNAAHAAPCLGPAPSTGACACPAVCYARTTALSVPRLHDAGRCIAWPHFSASCSRPGCLKLQEFRHSPQGVVL